MHAFGTWIARRRSLPIAVVVVALTTAAQPAGLVTEQLVVSGAVKSGLALNVDALKAFGADQIGTVMAKRRVDGRDVDSQVRGVRLTAVLEKAGLASSDQNDWKHTMFSPRRPTATASCSRGPSSSTARPAATSWSCSSVTESL